MRTRVTRALADLDYYQSSPLGWKHGTVIVWAGMRGVVTLAAAQTLPRDTPERALLVFVAFLVAVGSLMLQGFTLPWLVRLLKLEGSGRAGPSAEEQRRLGDEMRLAAASGIASGGLVRRDGSAFSAELLDTVGSRMTQPPDDDVSARAKDVLELRLALIERHAGAPERAVARRHVQHRGAAACARRARCRPAEPRAATRRRGLTGPSGVGAPAVSTRPRPGENGRMSETTDAAVRRSPALADDPHAETSPLHLPHQAADCPKCFTELQRDRDWWQARPAGSRLVGLVISRDDMPSVVEQRDELTRFGVPIEGFRHPRPRRSSRGRSGSSASSAASAPATYSS